MAERAGVAVSSASRALSDHPAVSVDLRDRVHTAARELGYRPNLLAQGLRSGASLSVGFVVRDISSPLFAEIALGAEIALRERGYAMLLTNSEGRPDLDLAHLRLFRQRRVDGLLLSLADEGHAPTLDELELVRSPVVLIDREVPRPGGLGAVLCDHAAGMHEACAWLAANGHRSVGLVGGPLSLRPGRECAKALEEFAAREGLQAAIQPGPFTERHGREAATRLLGRPDAPTALIAGSSQILPGVLSAIGDRRDVELVTFDGAPLLDAVGRPVGTIFRQPLDMGRAAAELLLRQLDGGEPQSVTVPAVFQPAR